MLLKYFHHPAPSIHPLFHRPSLHLLFHLPISHHSPRFLYFLYCYILAHYYLCHYFVFLIFIFISGALFMIIWVPGILNLIIWYIYFYHQSQALTTLFIILIQVQTILLSSFINLFNRLFCANFIFFLISCIIYLFNLLISH